MSIEPTCSSPDDSVLLTTKVKTWLETQGYPLEMRTAITFRRAGFEVQQAVHILDSETGKARETDIIAIHPDYLGITRIVFVIECKASHKPWILLGSHDTLTGHSRAFSFAVTSPKARGVLNEKIIDQKDFPWFWKEGFVGHSFRQALLKTEDRDHAYAAAHSVAKASLSLARGGSDEYQPFSFVFPLIVVDAPLIQCSVSSAGDLETEQVEEGEFLFSTYLPEAFRTCIRVVTLERLASFVVEAVETANRLRASLKDEETLIREAWKQSD